MELNLYVTVFGIILQIFCGVLNCIEQNMAENCVLSFVVPKESIKNSCNAELKFTKKIQSLENMVRTLRQRVSHLQMMATHSQPHNTEQILVKKVQNLETKLDNILNSNKKSVPNLKNISELPFWENLIKPYIEEQLQTISRDVLHNMRKASQRRRSRSHSNALTDPPNLNRFERTNTRHLIGETQTGNKDVNFGTRVDENTIDELAEESGEGFLPVFNTVEDTASQSRNAVSEQDHSQIGDHAKTESMNNATMESIKSTLWNHVQLNVNSLLQNHTMKTNEVTANYMSITESKLKHLINIMAQLQRNQLVELKTIETTNNSTRSHVTEHLDIFQRELADLVTRVDVLQNQMKSSADDHANIETFQTELRSFIKRTISTSTRSIASKLEAQKHKITMLERFQQIFQQTLQHYNNESRKFEEEINQRLDDSHNKLIDTLTLMNSTKTDDTDMRLQVVEDISHALETASYETRIEITDLQERVRDDYYLFQSSMDKIKEENKNIMKKQTYVSTTVTNVIQAFKKLEAQMKLDTNSWAEYNFSYSGHNNECFGKQYLRKKKEGQTTKLVGVILCSAEKYKIVLGETLESEFLDIGDQHGFGEDHCEFVGASSDDKIEVGQGNMLMDSSQGYRREDWGQDVEVGTLSFMTPCPPWYKCGITIP